MPAGQTRTFDWKVTAVRAGTYSLRYRVAAGIDGKAIAESFDGAAPRRAASSRAYHAQPGARSSRTEAPAG